MSSNVSNDLQKQFELMKQIKATQKEITAELEKQVKLTGQLNTGLITQKGTVDKRTTDYRMMGSPADPNLIKKYRNMDMPDVPLAEIGSMENRMPFTPKISEETANNADKASKSLEKAIGKPDKEGTLSNLAKNLSVTDVVIGASAITGLIDKVADTALAVNPLDVVMDVATAKLKQETAEMVASSIDRLITAISDEESAARIERLGNVFSILIGIMTDLLTAADDAADRVDNLIERMQSMSFDDWWSDVEDWWASTWEARRKRGRNG